MTARQRTTNGLKSVMKTMWAGLTVATAVSLFCASFAAGAPDVWQGRRSVLWYDRPATAWHEALPIGDGRLGAMIYGGGETETIALSEETVWSGRPHDYANPGAFEHLTELRELILSEQYDAAAKFGAKHSLGVPPGQQRYQSLSRLRPNQVDPVTGRLMEWAFRAEKTESCCMR